MIVLDTGYDVTRLAFLLADLPVELVGRLRSDRVLARPAEPRARRDAAARAAHGPRARPGRPGHLARPASTPRSTDTTRYGTAQRPRLGPAATRGWTHRGSWLDHAGELPIIEGTLIRLQVDHLPGDRDPEAGVAVDLDRPARPRADVDRCVAGVPAPLRSRTHLPAVQADPRLDPPRSSATPPPPTAGPG